MPITWTHVGPTVVAAFLASLVEFIEALTVVIAVGVVRGWRGAVMGSGAAALTLLVSTVLLGPALLRIPLGTVQIGVGSLLLLFGMRWLRKAILRAAGVIPIHDEAAIYEREERALRALPRAGRRIDTVAVATAYKITMLEGIEVLFIVLALGAGGMRSLIAAGVGALAALLAVTAFGIVVHRPLSRIPENALKLLVGVLLSAFGTFWVGEGLGVAWPGQDWSILGLIAGFLLTALLAAPMCRRRARRSAPLPPDSGAAS
ncbi:MAG: hypothetical protein M3N97_16315 [Pseudomonadota bacterium]|nr:hypothetical protein [Pseudomonadota bacterium]